MVFILYLLWCLSKVFSSWSFRDSASLLITVLFILQQSDLLAQRVRFLVEKASMKHDKENESAKRLNSKKDDDVVSNNNRKNVDLDSSFKWNIENDLLRWENKWYISSKLFKRKLLKQNHDDSYVDHFKHERIFCQTHRDSTVYLMINKRRSKKWERKKRLSKLINPRRLISLINSSWYWSFNWVNDTKSWHYLSLFSD